MARDSFAEKRGEGWRLFRGGHHRGGQPSFFSIMDGGPRRNHATLRYYESPMSP